MTVLAAAIAILAWSSDARATHGGPSMVEVLGYDSGDHKIYYRVLPGGEVDAEYTLFFMRTTGQHAGKAQRILSIYKNLPKEWGAREDEIARRVAKLQRRLRKMRPVAKSKPIDGLDDALPKGLRYVSLKRKVLKRWKHPDDYGKCSKVRVTVKRPGTPVTGTIEMTECGGEPIRATAVYKIPGSQRLFVLLSSKPDLWEGGYQNQKPLLLSVSR